MSQDPIWSDDALHTSNIPGREQFAVALAARIDQTPLEHNSTVFGLVGAWGTGKTTLLSEIRTHLQAADWQIVDFSPWSAGDVGSITSEFAVALASAFPDKSGGKLREAILKYARFGTPALALIPFAGATVSGLADAALSELGTRPPWQVTFDDLSKQIAQQGSRVLMVVDDVDRLDHDELRSLLRVVRLLGRFRNVHYLLAYDQITIDHKLRASNADGGTSEFMEKIVQHPFEVPPAPLVTRRNWCRALVEEHGGDIPAGLLDSGGLEPREDLVRLLADGIETPRSALRLGEQLQGLAPLLANAEIDPLDFIALTWLRISQHAVWNDVRTRPERYLHWTQDDTNDLPDPRLEHLPELVVRGQVPVVSRILQFLFERMTMPRSAQRKWRLHNERYFHRYFVVGLTEADVSERLVDAALEAAIEGRPDDPALDELRGIVLGPDGERGTLAMDLAQAARSGAARSSRLLVDFLRDIRNELEDLGEDRAGRTAAVDRWLVHEAEVAISSHTFTPDEIVEKFGYNLLVRAGYAARRNHRTDFSSFRAPYDRAIRKWVERQRTIGGFASSNGDELPTMTAFALALLGAESRGFLGETVRTIDDLLALTGRFVTYSYWVGSGSHYELTFRRDEFVYAVGDALQNFVPDLLPSVPDIPDYDHDDLAEPNLTVDERRDFAIRRLREVLAPAEE